MNVWGCCRRRASVAKARMELFAERIVRTIRQQQRGGPIWTIAKGINQNRKSPKNDWFSLLSAVNPVDEHGREHGLQDRSIHVVNGPFYSALVRCSRVEYRDRRSEAMQLGPQDKYSVSARSVIFETLLFYLYLVPINIGIAVLSSTQHLPILHFCVSQSLSKVPHFSVAHPPRFRPILSFKNQIYLYEKPNSFTPTHTP